MRSRPHHLEAALAMGLRASSDLNAMVAFLSLIP